MKKIVLAITILFWGIIIFFSIYGETLFVESVPKVTINGVYSVMSEDGTTTKLVQKSGVFEGKYVYTVNEMMGFSTTLRYLQRHEVEVAEYDEHSYILVSGGEGIRRYINSIENGEPADGIRVTMDSQLDGFLFG